MKEYQFYLAPMEGVTGYVYRNAHHDFYPGLTGYMTPFLSPYHERSLKPKELQDVMPENNGDLALVPQILTNSADDFIRTARDLKKLGYQEINLNLGCPSGTVTAKGKGAGFLAKQEELEAFLDRIFTELASDELDLSIKTRLGAESEEETASLVELYNRFPISKLTVHARVWKDFYKNNPRYEAFDYVRQHYKGDVIYNGDLFDEAAIRRFSERFPDQKELMIGRGFLRNPALACRIADPGWDRTLEKDRLQEFMARLLSDYKQFMYGGDTPVLYKMKEIWLYLLMGFDNTSSFEKKMKKCRHLSEYEILVRTIFNECELK